MKLSARSRYASRILLELARNKSGAPMSAATLSQHTGVSVQFVEQILKPLKQSGLTRSIRGAAGGHCLAKASEDVSLGEVVRLMEGGIMLTVCCGEKANDCPRKDGCLTRRAWVKVSRMLERELDSISLAMLLEHGGAVCPEGEQRVEKEAMSKRRTATLKAVAAPRRSRTVIRKAKLSRH